MGEAVGGSVVGDKVCFCSIFSLVGQFWCENGAKNGVFGR
jgi:hypothetical protein